MEKSLIMTKFSKLICCAFLIFGCLFPLYGCNDPLDKISLSLACDEFDKNGGQFVSLIVDESEPEKAEVKIDATLDGLSDNMLDKIDWRYDSRFLNLQKSEDGHSITLIGINPTTERTKVVAYSVENVKAQSVIEVAVSVKIKKIDIRPDLTTFGIPVATEFRLNPQDLLVFTPANATVPNFEFTISGLGANTEKRVASGESFTINNLVSNNLTIDCMPKDSLYSLDERIALTCRIPNVKLYTALNTSNVNVFVDDSQDQFVEFNGAYELSEPINLIHNDELSYRKDLSIFSNLGGVSQDIIVDVAGIYRGNELTEVEWDRYVYVDGNYDESAKTYKLSIQGLDVVDDLRVKLDLRLTSISNSTLFTFYIPVIVSSSPNSISIEDDYSDGAYYTTVDASNDAIINFDLIPFTAKQSSKLQLIGLNEDELREQTSLLNSPQLPAQFSEYKKRVTLSLFVNGKSFNAIGLKKGRESDSVGGDYDIQLEEIELNQDNRYSVTLKNGDSCGIVILKVKTELLDISRYLVLNLVQKADIFMDCEIRIGETTCRSALTKNTVSGALSLALGYSAEDSSLDVGSATLGFKMNINNSREVIPYNAGNVEGNLVFVEVENNNIVEIVDLNADGSVVADSDWGKFTIRSKANGSTYVYLRPQSGEQRKILVNVYSMPSQISAMLSPEIDVTNTVGFDTGFIDIRSTNILQSGNRVLLANESTFDLCVLVDNQEIDNDGNFLDISVTANNIQIDNIVKGEYSLYVGDYDLEDEDVMIELYYYSVVIDSSTGRYGFSTETKSKIFTFKVSTFNRVAKINLNKSGVPIDSITLLTVYNASDEVSDFDKTAISSSQEFTVSLTGHVAGLTRMINKLECRYDSEKISVTLADEGEGEDEDLEVSPDGGSIDFVNNEVRLIVSANEFVNELTTSDETFLEFRVTDYNGVEYISQIYVLIKEYRSTFNLKIENKKNNGVSIENSTTEIRLEPYREEGLTFDTICSVTGGYYDANLCLVAVNAEKKEKNADNERKVIQLGSEFFELQQDFIGKANFRINNPTSDDLTEKPFDKIKVMPEYNEGRFHFEIDGISAKNGYTFVYLLPSSILSENVRKFIFEDDTSNLESVLNSLVQYAKNNQIVMLIHIPVGNEDDPYYVATSKDLKDIGRALDKSYVLTQDISIENEEAWEPIGNASGTFTGTLKSKGNDVFTIIGLNLDAKTNSCYGLFSQIGNGAKLMNFKIEVESYKIEALESYGTDPRYLGILAGEIVAPELGVESSSIVIQNIVIECNSLMIQSQNAFVGAIGHVANAEVVCSELKVSYQSVFISEKANFGGLIGQNDGLVFSIEDVTIHDDELDIDVISQVSLKGNGISSYKDPNKHRNSVNANIVVNNSNSVLSELIIGFAVAVNNGTIVNIETNGQLDFDSQSSYIGGLAGINMGKIAQACSYVEINQTKFLTDNDVIQNFVGGAVGQNSGELVSVCYEIASVGTGTIGIHASGVIGGLVGVENLGNISVCRVIADIRDNSIGSIVSEGGIVGGLIGKVESSVQIAIEETFVIVNLQGGETVGGFIGDVAVGGTKSVTIQSCYADSIILSTLDDVVAGAFVGKVAGNLSIGKSYAVSKFNNTDLSNIIGDGVADISDFVLNATDRDSYSAFFLETNPKWMFVDTTHPILVNNMIIILKNITLSISNSISDEGVVKHDTEKLIMINYNANPKPQSDRELSLKNLLGIEYEPIAEGYSYKIVITSSDESVISVIDPNDFDECKLIIHRIGSVWLTVMSRANADVFDRVQIAVVYGFDDIGLNLDIASDDSGKYPIFVDDSTIVSIDYLNNSVITNLSKIAGGVHVVCDSSEVNVGAPLVVSNTDTGINEYDVDNLDKFSITALIKSTTNGTIITIKPYVKVNFYNGDNLETVKIFLDSKTFTLDIKDGTGNITFDVANTEAQSIDSIQGKIYFYTNEFSDDISRLKYNLFQYDESGNNWVDATSKLDLSYSNETVTGHNGSVDFSIELRDKFLTEDQRFKLVVTPICSAADKKEIEFTFKPQVDVTMSLKFYSDMPNGTSLNLDNAGFLDSTTILPGHFGLLVIDVTPYFADFDSLLITSSGVEEHKIYMSQRVRHLIPNEDPTKGYGLEYSIWQRDVGTLSDGLSLAKVSEIDDLDNTTFFDGAFYVRVLTAGGLAVGTTVPLNIRLLKNNVVVCENDITLEVRDASELTLSYNPSRFMKYDANEDVNWYYVARGTGGFVDYTNNPVEEVNQNIITVNVDRNRYDNIHVSVVDGPGEIIPYNGVYYLQVSNTAALGSVITVKLTADIVVNGKVRPDEYSLKFYVVDIFIDDITFSVPELIGQPDPENLNLAYILGKQYDLRIFNSCHVWNESKGSYEFNNTSSIAELRKLNKITCNYNDSRIQNDLKLLVSSMQSFAGWSFNIEPDDAGWYDECFKLGKNTDRMFYLESKRAQSGYRISYSLSYYYNAGELIIGSNAQSIVKTHESGLGFYQILSKYTPNPIRTVDDLIMMRDGYHYILINDIVIPSDMEWVPLNKNILSLDGNGFVIYFGDPLVSDEEMVKNSFREGTSNNYGLFEQVNNGTVLKNIIIKFAKGIILPQTAQRFGLLAAVNNGIIYNCAVEGNAALPTEIDMQTIVYAGGLVAENNSFITNSRVVNLSLVVTRTGVVGGLAARNSGNISSSFYKGGKLTTGSEVSGDFNAGGLVDTNSGHIWGSFVGELAYDSENSNYLYDTQIKSTYSAGFVRANSGVIEDCYSAVDILQGSTARSSGFVLINSGTISRVYTLSRVRQINSEDDSVAGCEPLITSQSGGSLTDAYYVDFGYEAHSRGIVVEMNDLNNIYKYNNFIFANNEFDGVWVIMTNTNRYFTPNRFKHIGPMLVSASLIATPCLDYNTDSIGGQTEETTNYFYTRNVKSYFTNSKITDANGRYSDEFYDYQYAPVVITSAEELNEAFNISAGNNYTKYGEIISGALVDSMRLAANIDYSQLDSNTPIYGQEVEYAGLFEGNRYSISNLNLHYASSQSKEVFGLVGRLVSVISESNTTYTGAMQNFAVSVVKVRALNTYCVGALVGEMNSGSIVNVQLTSVDDDSIVEGRNIVGGLVGLVLGKSQLRFIDVNISVSSTFVDNNHIFYNVDLVRLINSQQGGGMLTILEVDTLLTKITQYGYAGGVAGVLDSESKEGYVDHINVRIDKLINGKTIGGLFGLVGAQAVVTYSDVVYGSSAKALSHEIAGGLVGENHGIIKLSTADYSGKNLELFNMEEYTISSSFAIGGLVGVNIGFFNQADKEVINYATGQIILSGTYLDVKSDYADNVGGLVGVSIGGKLMGVFASGDVRGKLNANIAGLVGFVTNTSNENFSNLLKYYYLSDGIEKEAEISLEVEMHVGNAVAYNATKYNNTTNSENLFIKTIDGSVGDYLHLFEGSNYFNPTGNASIDDGQIVGAKEIEDEDVIYASWDSAYYDFGLKYGKKLPIKRAGLADVRYEIGSAAEMWKLYWHPELDYIITKDIDLSDIELPIIGTDSIPFTGSISAKVDDGKVKRITLQEGSAYFIGVTDKNVRIENILLVGGSEFVMVNTNNGNLTIAYTMSVDLTQNEPNSGNNGLNEANKPFTSCIPVLLNTNNKSFTLSLPPANVLQGAQAGGQRVNSFNTIVKNNSFDANVTITANNLAKVVIKDSIIDSNFGNLTINFCDILLDKDIANYLVEFKNINIVDNGKYNGILAISHSVINFKTENSLLPNNNYKLKISLNDIEFNNVTHVLSENSGTIDMMVNGNISGLTDLIESNRGILNLTISGTLKNNEGVISVENITSNYLIYSNISTGIINFEIKGINEGNTVHLNYLVNQNNGSMIISNSEFSCVSFAQSQENGTIALSNSESSKTITIADFNLPISNVRSIPSTSEGGSSQPYLTLKIEKITLATDLIGENAGNSYFIIDFVNTNSISYSHALITTNNGVFAVTKSSGTENTVSLTNVVGVNYGTVSVKNAELTLSNASSEVVCAVINENQSGSVIISNSKLTTPYIINTNLGLVTIKANGSGDTQINLTAVVKNNSSNLTITSSELTCVDVVETLNGGSIKLDSSMITITNLKNSLTTHSSTIILGAGSLNGFTQPNLISSNYGNTTLMLGDSDHQIEKDLVLVATNNSGATLTILDSNFKVKEIGCEAKIENSKFEIVDVGNYTIETKNSTVLNNNATLSIKATDNLIIAKNLGTINLNNYSVVTCPDLKGTINLNNCSLTISGVLTSTIAKTTGNCELNLNNVDYSSYDSAEYIIRRNEGTLIVRLNGTSIVKASRVVSVNLGTLSISSTVTVNLTGANLCYLVGENRATLNLNYLQINGCDGLIRVIDSGKTTYLNIENSVINLLNANGALINSNKGTTNVQLSGVNSFFYTSYIVNTENNDAQLFVNGEKYTESKKITDYDNLVSWKPAS